MKSICMSFLTLVVFYMGAVDDLHMCKINTSDDDPYLEMEHEFLLNQGESCLMFPGDCSCQVYNQATAPVTILRDSVTHNGVEYIQLHATRMGEASGECRCAEPGHPSHAIGWRARVS